MKIDQSLIIARGYLPTDEGAIYTSWLKGLRKGNQWFGLIARSDYFQNYHRVLEKILTNPETRVELIALKEDPDVILSYIVFGGSVLHWVSTRENWRRLGLAQILIAPHTFTEVTHLTELGKEIKPKEWAFNPFSI